MNSSRPLTIALITALITLASVSSPIMGMSTDSLILAVSCLRVALDLRSAITGGRMVAKSDIG